MTYEDQIFNSHPMGCDDPNRFKADELAMKLVGERHEKRDLVDLVRWLIMDKAKIAFSDLQPVVEADAGKDCDFCHEKSTGSEIIYFCDAHRTA